MSDHVRILTHEGLQDCDGRVWRGCCFDNETDRAACACQRLSLEFEQMFEKSNNPDRPENWIGNQRPEIFLTGGEPIEFTYNGQRFRIHTVLSSWRESGGWWNRASDGLFRPDDGSRALWRVEAAPIGVMKTFEIERIEEFGHWRIRPTSRPA
jgi:hypothetical protein